MGAEAVALYRSGGLGGAAVLAIQIVGSSLRPTGRSFLFTCFFGEALIGR
jgi:hypothetical protein